MLGLSVFDFDSVLSAGEIERIKRAFVSFLHPNATRVSDDSAVANVLTVNLKFRLSTPNSSNFGSFNFDFVVLKSFGSLDLDLSLEFFNSELDLFLSVNKLLVLNQ